MTLHERAAIRALYNCRMAPATAEKRFTREMDSHRLLDPDRPLTVKQTAYLWRLVVRYRRQIEQRPGGPELVVIAEVMQMDEKQWMTSSDPAPMLRLVNGEFMAGSASGWKSLMKASDRKLRLFVVASLRYLIGRGDPPPSVHQLAAISELERFVDDGDEDGLFEAWQDANLPRSGIALGTRAGCRMHAQMMTEYLMADMRQRECEILRDLMGNPFRRLILANGPCAHCKGYGCSRCVAWLTPQVRMLAAAAYEDRQPDGTLDPFRLALVADALEETGASGELLTHLRNPGPHVRGCWCLDCLLGKE